MTESEDKKVEEYPKACQKHEVIDWNCDDCIYNVYYPCHECGHDPKSSRDRESSLRKKLEMARDLIVKYRPVIKGEDIKSVGTTGALYEWDEALKALDAKGDL